MTASYLRDPGSIRLLVEFGLGNGIPEQLLLSRSGLKREQLDDPLVEVESAQELRVIENLLTLTRPYPLLGMRLGWDYSITTYGAWGFALLCSKTAQEALELALRFLPLTYAFCPITARPLQGHMAILFGEPVAPAPTKSFIIQRDMAAASKLLRSLLGEKSREARFLCTQAKPKTNEINLPADWGIEIEFGSSLNALIFDHTHLTTPLPLSNPLTSAACEQLCNALIQKRRTKQGTASIAKMYLRAHSGHGMLDLPRLAGKLHMSERALRRHLQEEGTSFSEILTEIRVELAAGMLSTGTYSMAHIADALGYSDQSSFSQAYKRWHGIPPSASRRNR